MGTLGPEHIVFGFMDPYTLSPYRTFTRTLMVPLKEPCLGTWTLRET